MMFILARPAHNLSPVLLLDWVCEYGDTTQRKLESRRLAVFTGLPRVFWTDCLAVIDRQHQRFPGRTYAAP